jgi:hypothetical protein
LFSVIAKTYKEKATLIWFATGAINIMNDVVNKCINCDSDAPFTWFCGDCTDAKETAYKLCRDLDIDDWIEVLIVRDTVLKAFNICRNKRKKK